MKHTYQLFRSTMIFSNLYTFIDVLRY